MRCLAVLDRALTLARALVLVCALSVAAPIAAQTPAPIRAGNVLRAGGELADMIDADMRGDQREVERLGRHGRAAWQAGRLQIQLHLQPGVAPEAVTDSMVQTAGGRVGDRGIDVMDVWLALADLSGFLNAHPQVAYARLPDRATPSTGKIMSQGATALRPGAVQCLADDATGVVVAVVDSQFEGLDQSVADGEVLHVVGNVGQEAGSHGTMCAQVVADVAPGAVIYPYRVETLASIQKFAKELSTKGNPKHISVVSHSMGWFGMSFGRSDGPLCAVTDIARDAGVAWVNASGNNGGGEFYTAKYVDADGDGRHDFQPKQPRLTWQQFGGNIATTVDWDDFTDRKQDFDLVLERLVDGKWQAVDTSKNKQGKFTPPVEQVALDGAPGIYGLQIVCKANCKPGTRLRVVNLGGGAGTFSVWNRNGNVYDPACCEGVLTVGAVYHGHYEAGPLEGYSSYGPTVDGRQKPEVVAPTGVATTFGDFYGTSAACPHAAGAVALYVAAGYEPLLAMKQVIKDAEQMGAGHPDEAYGWGRVTVRGTSLGWQCDAALPGEVTCATACGSVGVHQCGSTCQWSPCTPPADVCNGQDDDCDGVTDEQSACALGADASCTAGCGSIGKRVCGAGCAWGVCAPPAEACNGQDDDCNGKTDEGCPSAADTTGADGVGGKPAPAKDNNADSGCSSRPAGMPAVGGLVVVCLVLLRRRRDAAG